MKARPPPAIVRRASARRTRTSITVRERDLCELIGTMTFTDYFRAAAGGQTAHPSIRARC